MQFPSTLFYEQSLGMVSTFCGCGQMFCTCSDVVIPPFINPYPPLLVQPALSTLSIVIDRPYQLNRKSILNSLAWIVRKLQKVRDIDSEIFY